MNKFFFVAYILAILCFGAETGFLINIFVLIVYLPRAEIDRKLLSLFVCLLFPVIIATLYGIFFYIPRDIVRDIFYLLHPFLFSLTGICFAKNINMHFFFKGIIFTGITCATFFVITAIVQYGWNIFIDPRYVRDTFGSADITGFANRIFPVSALLLLIAPTVNLEVTKSKTCYRFGLVILLLAIYMSGFRTLIVSFLIALAFILYPWIKQNRKRLFIVVPMVAVVALILFSEDTMLGQLFLHSTEEMTVKEFSSPESINNNYRGWESYQAMETYRQGNLYEKLMGQGTGAIIDFKGVEVIGRDKVPILHNGYPYLLVKVGCIGLFFYMLFYVKIVQFSNNIRKQLKERKDIHRLFFFEIGIIASILIITMSVSAIVSPNGGLIGMMIGAIAQYILCLSKKTEN